MWSVYGVIEENISIDINESWNKFTSIFQISQIPEKLHHFTPSSIAISNILENQIFWLSPYDDMNDPSEITHGLVLSIEWVKNHLNNSNLNQNELAAYTYLFHKIQENKLAKNHFLDFYFTCFTAAGEMDIAQWREYANRGLGFCLEFKSKNSFYLQNTSIGQNITNPLSPIWEIYPVIYDDIQKNKLLGDFFKIFNNMIVKNNSTTIELIIQFLRQLCAFFKHQSYKPEKEWRHIQMGCNHTPLNKKVSSIEVFTLNELFREKLITSLPAQKEKLDSIDRIFCGPKQNLAQYKATKLKVDRIIKKIKSSHSISVEKSTVPMV